MREISTKKMEIGEHAMIDGVEYVAVEGSCGTCSNRSETGVCSAGLAVFCPMNGKIEKVKKEPSYRPYQDTDELIEDWKTRFKVGPWPSRSMPLVWVMSTKSTFMTKSIITDFMKYGVKVFGSIQTLKELYEDYTYLDGSPCGKEVTE